MHYSASIKLAFLRTSKFGCLNLVLFKKAKTFPQRFCNCESSVKLVVLGYFTYIRQNLKWGV